MSRLTRRAEADGIVFYPHCEDCEDFNCINCDFDVEIAKKLAHYEDLEEAGRLIELPCKVDDTVWCIDLNKIHLYELTEVTVRKKETVLFSVMDGFIKVIKPEDIGKTVFLTKAEAEVKLAKLKGGA